MFTALLHLTVKYRTNLDVSKRSTNRECNLYTTELPSVIKNHQVTGLVKKAGTAKDNDTQQIKSVSDKHIISH